jgi:hypothetical protein
MLNSGLIQNVYRFVFDKRVGSMWLMRVSRREGRRSWRRIVLGEEKYV